MATINWFDNSALFQKVRQATTKKEKKKEEKKTRIVLRPRKRTLDTKVSAVLAFTMPSGRSFQTLMLAETPDCMRWDIRSVWVVWNIYSLQCLGGAGINLEQIMLNKTDCCFPPSSAGCGMAGLFSFLPNTIKDWNDLPENTVSKHSRRCAAGMPVTLLVASPPPLHPVPGVNGGEGKN